MKGNDQQVVLGVLGVVVMSGLALLALGVGPCCVVNSSFSGSNPCTGTSTVVCDEGSGSGSSGWTTYTAAVWENCTEFDVPAGAGFIAQACDKPPTGHYRIGPPLPSGLCCWAPTGSTTVTSQRVPKQQFQPCGGSACGS